MIRTLLRSPPGLACILLAAGGSRRLGRPKQLLRRRGQSLLLQGAMLAEQLCGRETVVVVGAEHLRMRRVLRPLHKRITIARNPDWQRGISASLRAGMAQLSPDTRAAFVCLVDQPLIGRREMQRLTVTWQRHKGRVIAADYDGKPGVPAIIPRKLFGQLRRLHGDRGAARLFRQDPATIRIDMPAASVDIDSPEDADRFLPTGGRA